MSVGFGGCDGTTVNCGGSEEAWFQVLPILSRDGQCSLYVGGSGLLQMIGELTCGFVVCTSKPKMA